MAIPLALAFGAQSGLGAVAGLYGAIALGIFASFFGGTPTQISGPTGPMVVIAALVVGDAIERFGGLANGIPYIIGTFLMAGLFQVFLGVARFGQYIRYMPYPVISGFMTGIGVIIIVYQIFAVLGHVSPKGILNTLIHVPDVLTQINLEALFLGIATIATIYLFPRITRSVPNILLTLAAVSFVATWAGFNISVIGAIPSELPELKLSLLQGLNERRKGHVHPRDHACPAGKYRFPADLGDRR